MKLRKNKFYQHIIELTGKYSKIRGREKIREEAEKSGEKEEK